MEERARCLISQTNDPYLNLAMEDHIFNDMDPRENILFLWRNSDCVIIGKYQNPWTECNVQRLKEEPRLGDAVSIAEESRPSEQPRRRGELDSQWTMQRTSGRRRPWSFHRTEIGASVFRLKSVCKRRASGARSEDHGPERRAGGRRRPAGR